MPPRKNVAPSNAIHTFRCDLCSKGYPRQQDYESHLRSYDHNHRQRLAEMKKLTNRNDEVSAKKRGPDDLKSVPIDGAGRKAGAGPRFTKIGGAGDAPAGLRFKKVGVAVGAAAGGSAAGTATKEPDAGEDKLQKMMREQEELARKIEAMKREKEMQASSGSVEQRKDEDVVMGGVDEEDGEEYDFTKPTGCDHARCGGCKTDGIWEGGLESVGIAT